MPDDIEIFNFMLPPSPWSKKPYPSRWKMTIEEAAKRHPNATPIQSTRQVLSGKPLIPHSSGPMPGSEAWKRGER